MNPAMIVAIVAMLKEAALLFMELQGKDKITKDDLKAKTPEEILKELGIVLPPPPAPPPADPHAPRT